MEKEVLKSPCSDRARAIKRGRLPAVFTSISTRPGGGKGRPWGSEFRVSVSWR